MGFIGELFFVHFLPTSARNEPKKRRLGKGGFINQNATSRILIYINISPRPRPHPSVGKADEKGRFFIINGFNCTRNTVAERLRSKSSRFYKNNTATPPNNLRGSSFGYFSFKKSNTRFPDKSKFEQQIKRKRANSRWLFLILLLFSATLSADRSFRISRAVRHPRWACWLSTPSVS